MILREDGFVGYYNDNVASRQLSLSSLGTFTYGDMRGPHVEHEVARLTISEAELAATRFVIAHSSDMRPDDSQGYQQLVYDALQVKFEDADTPTVSLDLSESLALTALTKKLKDEAIPEQRQTVALHTVLHKLERNARHVEKAHVWLIALAAKLEHDGGTSMMPLSFEYASRCSARRDVTLKPGRPAIDPERRSYSMLIRSHVNAPENSYRPPRRGSGGKTMRIPGLSFSPAH